YMDLFGGEKGFLEKLDALFNQSSDLPPDAPPDIAGMIGQYAHGNEPGHHVPYLYAYAGQPHKTQARVRFLLENMYHNAPDGLAGNEDCGQMSAWYIMSALGFYAVDPGADMYALGSPLFEKETIKLENGRSFTINALGAAHSPFVRSVRIGGRPLNAPFIYHSDIAS